VEPNDYVAVNSTSTAPENEAYCKVTVAGTLNISGPQVNRDLVLENFTDRYFTTPIGEQTVDFPPIEISDAPTLYAFILEPSITYYTAVLAKTSTEACSVVSGASPEWHFDGETATTIVRISSGAKERDIARLNLIDFTYYLGGTISVTAKLRILTEEAEIETWNWYLVGITVPASDTVTIPLSWNVIPEFPSVTILPLFMAISLLALVFAKRRTRRRPA
jgi:hypothetical protein